MLTFHYHVIYYFILYFETDFIVYLMATNVLNQFLDEQMLRHVDFMCPAKKTTPPNKKQNHNPQPALSKNNTSPLPSIVSGPIGENKPITPKCGFVATSINNIPINNEAVPCPDRLKKRISFHTIPTSFFAILVNVSLLIHETAGQAMQALKSASGHDWRRRVPDLLGWHQSPLLW